MSFFEDIGRGFVSFLDWAGDSIRRITAFLFIFFTLGVILGWKLATSANPGNVELAILATLALAGISYVSTGFAVLLFILIFVLFFIIL